MSPPFGVCRRRGAVRAVSRGARRATAGGARGARHRPALHASGRSDRARAGRPQRRRHHADRVGQDALLQRAGPARDPAGSRRAARCTCFRPRRSRRISSPSCRRCARRIAAASGEQIGVFTYDGDTPQDARRTIRARAHLVLSNPDMVHSGILPHHPRWAKLFENLRYVVIDELHAYRGVFGSHLCNVLRRLRRICRHYGSNPVFLCSSATIANPRELAERLDRAALRARRARAARRAARSSSSSSTRRSSTTSSASAARIWARRAASRRSSSSATCSSSSSRRAACPPRF